MQCDQLSYVFTLTAFLTSSRQSLIFLIINTVTFNRSSTNLLFRSHLWHSLSQRQTAFSRSSTPMRQSHSGNCVWSRYARVFQFALALSSSAFSKPHLTSSIDCAMPTEGRHKQTDHHQTAIISISILRAFLDFVRFHYLQCFMLLNSILLVQSASLLANWFLVLTK